jgi:hypothetical protein
MQNATTKAKVEDKISPQTALPQIRRYEFIACRDLALRWCLPESWIREQVRTRSADPIPHVRFGKYVRFRWGSPELEEWAERRIVSGSNGKAGRALGKESKL